MSDIVKAVEEAVRIAKGEIPAARIHHQGHAYVPEADYTRLTAENERLRAALEWYADLENYKHIVNTHGGGLTRPSKIALDQGNNARAALSPPPELRT